MRLRRRRLTHVREDDGTTLIEVGVAALIMAVAITGVMGSMGSGLSLVGHSRQRSSAVAVAQERLERARNLPYAQVAICKSTDPASRCYQQPVHQDAESNPDHSVTADVPPRYQVDGSTTEPLLVDVTNGALAHIDDPFTLGTTEFSVYQYVTWFDDPSITGTTQDYKRVVVVVTWKFPVNSGPSHTVTESTFVGHGGVIVPSPSATSTPAPTVSPSPTPTAPPSTTCGKIDILSGSGAAASFTNSTTVQIALSPKAGCNPSPATGQLSNDGTTFGPATYAVPSTAVWTIPSGDGAKTVYARFSDGGTTSATIQLDQSRPSVVTLSTVSCGISGGNRTITVQWTTSTDTNLLGYRLYKSINSAAFTPLLTTATTNGTDTDSKGYGSLRFMVRAYDKGGNESVDSNVLSFTKNSC